MSNLQEPKKILLISDSPVHYKVFGELCEEKEFIICDIATNLLEIKDLLNNSCYDLIIASSTVQEEDAIGYFHENQFAVEDKTPLIFILQKNLSKSRMKLFDKLKINFLYEDYLDLPLLNYSLKTALQKQKVLHLMKENQLRYKSLYDHTLDINLITDVDFKVVDANVQGRKQLNFSDAFELQTIFQSIREYKKFIKLLNEVEQVSRFETYLKFKKKDVICLVDAFLLNNSSQERSGAHIVIRNIDAEKKTQEAENRANKLMVTGKFLRSLAHEIRNPLTNINLALEHLTTEVSIPEDSKLYLNIVQRSANRVKDLLDEIMTAYKTAETNLELESLHNIIENALRFANDRLLLKDVQLNLSLEVKNDLIKADKVKLTTALLNLIVNACEAIDHKDGQISIKTSKKDDHLILVLRDNGCGMNATQTAALFDPFYTGKSKGLGLGLTTAQNVIFAHKGTITVKSRENVGTEFKIRIPAKS